MRKKKSVNTWIILGGIAIMAIAGALIVRFSHAATINYKYAAPTVFTCPTNYKTYSAIYAKIAGLRCQRKVQTWHDLAPRWYYQEPTRFSCPVSYSKYIDTNLVAFCRQHP